MNIQIREYQENDREMLLKLINKLAEYAKSIDPISRVQNLPGYAEASLEDMLGDISKDGNEGKILLAEVDGKTIGYEIVAVWKQPKLNELENGKHKTGEILDLYVDEKYRGLGIGKKLLQEAEDYFRKSGCDSMWLQVFEPNKNAHEVYKKYGFIDREIGMLKQLK